MLGKKLPGGDKVAIRNSIAQPGGTGGNIKRDRCRRASHRHQVGELPDVVHEIRKTQLTHEVQRRPRPFACCREVHYLHQIDAAQWRATVGSRIVFKAQRPQSTILRLNGLAPTRSDRHKMKNRNKEPSRPLDGVHSAAQPERPVHTRGGCPHQKPPTGFADEASLFSPMRTLFRRGRFCDDPPTKSVYSPGTRLHAFFATSKIERYCAGIFSETCLLSPGFNRTLCQPTRRLNGSPALGDNDA